MLGVWRLILDWVGCSCDGVLVFGEVLGVFCDVLRVLGDIFYGCEDWTEWWIEEFAGFVVFTVLVLRIRVHGDDQL